MRRSKPHPITVALAGGGALGAFSWGVLERLLDTAELRIDVVSGASAGAMNAAMVAQGLALGGVDVAKANLEAFWRRVATASSVSGLSAGQAVMARRLMPPLIEAMLQSGTDPALSGSFNLLRPIVVELLATGAFALPHAPKIVVSATSVRTGQARLFANEEITADVLLASCCLPAFFPPVLIDGEAYWDGAFSSNPPLRPLIEAGAPSDVIVVRTAPFERPGVPLTRREVGDRATELAFGAALRHELRSLAVAQRLLQHMPVLPTGLRRLRNARLHMIGAETVFQSLPPGSHLNTGWTFLCRMRTLGQQAADGWLAANMPALGRRSTVSPMLFDGPRLGDLSLAHAVQRRAA